jgi:hypothetical protein
MWRDPVCEPINPRTTIQKGDLVIAMNNIRKPYTLYKRKAKLRALQEKFSDYIQDEIMPHMVSKYQSVKSLAKTRLPAGNGEAVNNAVAKKIAMRNLDANVDVPLKKRDASKLFLLNAHQANLSSGKPKTGWVSALTFVRIVPKYRQGVGARACEDFCVKYEKALLDTYYSKRWDPVIEQKCKRFHESVFGLNPMDLNFNRATDPLTDIPFGIHVAPYMLYLTERKLKLKWTQDFLRRIYFKIPGKQPVAWEDIIASYYGSPDKANLANQSHKESLAELRDMLEDEPYKYYTDLLGPEGLGTLNHIGIGISYVDQDPAIAIIVILFTPEHIY